MTPATYREAVESLHTFFLRWYTGEASEGAFDEFDTALGPRFKMVTPDGTRHDREAVLSLVRDAFSRYEPGTFRIDIRGVDVVEEYDDAALVSYEEHQETPTEKTSRHSTVLFEVNGDAPEWRYLHETWLDRDN
jgi:hypothetical protein